MNISKSWKGVIITTIFLIVMFAAVLFGPKIIGEDERNTYNGFPFQKKNMLWITTAQKGGQPYQIPFYYHPTEVEDIVARPGAEQLLLRASQDRPNTTVFITLDPELQSKAVVAAVEISRITGSRYNLLNLETHGALTRKPEEQRANTQNPIVTCEQANNETIVVWLKKGPQNLIYNEGNCIMLQGETEEDILKTADRFAYMLIGVMD